MADDFRKVSTDQLGDWHGRIVPVGISPTIQQAMIEMQRIAAAKRITEDKPEVPSQTAATAYIRNERRARWYGGSLKANIGIIMTGYQGTDEAVIAKEKRLFESRQLYAGARYEVQPRKLVDHSAGLATRWRRNREYGPLKGPCVYVVEGLPSVFKIGRTDDMAGRLSALRVGSPVPLKLVACIPLPGHPWTAEEMEALLHWHFGDFRLHGEWFHLDEQLMIELLSSAGKWVVRYYTPEFLSSETPT